MIHILVTGNPVDGFQYVGPFEDQTAVMLYVDQQRDGIDWWMVELQPPPAEFMPPGLKPTKAPYNQEEVKP